MQWMARASRKPSQIRFPTSWKKGGRSGSSVLRLPTKSESQSARGCTHLEDLVLLHVHPEHFAKLELVPWRGEQCGGDMW